MVDIGLRLKILECLNIFLLMPFLIKGYSYKRMIFEPTFLDTPRNVTVHMNELAQLQCRIQHLGPKQVAWRKVSMDYPLTVGIVTFDPKEDISVNFKDYEDEGEGLSQWDLIIKRAQPRHSGMYECQISAKTVYTHYVYLNVLDTPLELKPAISLTGTAFVNLHDSIKLVCNATGGMRAPSLIDWFFNGHMIRGRDSRWGSRLQINDYVPDIPGRTLVSELTIDKTVFSDKGKYVCRTFAEDDFRTTSIDVTILNTEKAHDKREENQKPLSGTGQGSKNKGLSYRVSVLTVCICIIISTFR